VVGSQTTNLTPGPSFAHNLGDRCPNGQCEAIFNIYASRPFQCHQEHFNVSCFGPYCRTLNIQESRRTPSPQLWECWASPPHLAKVGLRQRFFTISTYYSYTIVFNKYPTNLCIHKTNFLKLIGRSLWENYVHPYNIILIEQMWQSKDIFYKSFLKKSYNRKFSKSNFELFKTQFFSNLKINIFEDPWRMATFLIPWNELHNAINHQIIKINSNSFKQKCYTILAIDIYFLNPIHNDI